MRILGRGAVPSANPYYPVGSDCVLYHAYWDGSAVDHSIQGNNGTLYGTSFIPTGLSFDGTNDYELAPTNGWIGVIATDYWVKHGPGNILDDGGAPTTVWQWGQYSDGALVAEDTGGTGWFPYIRTPLGGYRYCRDVISNYANCGAWHHIAFSYDAGSDTFLMFVDEAPILSTGQGGTGNPFSAAALQGKLISFGAYRYADGGPYGLCKCIIGEIRFWTSAIDSTKASSIFNATKTRYSV